MEEARSPLIGDGLVAVLWARITPLEIIANGLSDTPGIEGEVASVLDMEHTVLLIVLRCLGPSIQSGCSIARESVRGASGNDYASEPQPTEVVSDLDLS